MLVSTSGVYGRCGRDTAEDAPKKPINTYERVSKQGDFLSPILYAIIVGWIGAVVSSMWGIALGSTLGRFLPADMNQMAPFFAGSIGQLMVTVVVAPFFMVFGVLIWSGIVHLCALMVGADGDSDAGYEGTLRAVSYSSVAQLAQVIPIFGGVIACFFILPPRSHL